MATGNQEVAAEAAANAGFTGDGLKTIVAIGGAESGWNPVAHNAKPPDDSYGVWQINMLGSLGPARRAQFGLKRNEDLYDPQVNARAAWALSNHGTNFAPWSTYTNGAYKKYLTPLAGGGMGAYTPPSIPSVTLPDVGSSITSGINAVTSQLGKLAGNVTLMLLILVLLVIGVLLLRGHTILSAGSAVAGAVGGPVGKAATAVTTRNPGGYEGGHRA
jgi:hypothetical protein